MDSDLNHRIFRMGLITIAALSLTQCNKREQLKQEVALKQAQIEELKLQQKQVQTAIENTGNLGRYNTTQPKHLEDLKGEVASATAEVQNYKRQKEELTKEVDAIRTDIEQHRVKYR
ncbi:hypothetical protein SAMN02745166_04610 [Prosthecobacter debontii]|uniref:Uncharacterized protein n=1 Tax=Prosthecobacter debontii TaxID=48467 RepID=A0A1T4YZ30_9BACT|nr:hypothetical protein [Prosthecobacter debontii]SKB07070.1 hypothetical protein SAMN02745166_04610 [Prosthecobacter debontii]